MDIISHKGYLVISWMHRDGGTMSRIMRGCLFAALIFCGCSSKASTGTVSGGAAGVSATVSGSAAGSTSGGILGASLDEQDRKIMEQSSPRTVERMERGEPLTVNDVIKLHEGSVSDDTVIRYIHDTKTSYNLSQAQIRRLQEAGVSQRLVNYMIDTGR